MTNALNKPVCEALKQIATVKQDVYQNSIELFQYLLDTCINISQELSQFIQPIDDRVVVSCKSKSSNEFWLRFGGDLLIFSLHSNVFKFEENHEIYQNPYIILDTNRSYFATINVYNFLNDSIVYQRNNDIGELVMRLFVNKENKFYADGLNSLNTDFKDISNQDFKSDSLTTILYTCIYNCIEYQLIIPPLQEVRVMPLGAILAQNGNIPSATSKRLGFII